MDKSTTCEIQSCSEAAIGELCWRWKDEPRTSSTKFCGKHASQAEQLLRDIAATANKAIHIFLMVEP